MRERNPPQRLGSDSKINLIILSYLILSSNTKEVSKRNSAQHYFEHCVGPGTVLSLAVGLGLGLGFYPELLLEFGLELFLALSAALDLLLLGVVGAVGHEVDADEGRVDTGWFRCEGLLAWSWVGGGAG